MSNSFVIRCILAAAVGLTMGLLVQPLWLALGIALSINFAYGFACDEAKYEGQQETWAKVNPILDEAMRLLKEATATDV